MNLVETSALEYNWEEEGVYQLEETDPVQGGAEGISNRQASQLAIRTRNLHERLKALELIVPDEIISAIRGTVSEDLDTLQEIIEWTEQQLSTLDLSAVSENIISTIRGGVASDYDTLEKIRAVLSNYEGSVALTGTDVDWSGKPIKTKTLTANTTLTFSNLQVNKTVTLRITGNYALTLPASVKKISGTYDGTKVNIIQLLCVNATAGSEEVWYVISQETT